MPAGAIFPNTSEADSPRSIREPNSNLVSSGDQSRDQPPQKLTTMSAKKRKAATAMAAFQNRAVTDAFATGLSRFTVKRANSTCMTVSFCISRLSVLQVPAAIDGDRGRGIYLQLLR